MRFRFIQHIILLSVFSFAVIASATENNSPATVMVSVKPLALIYAALQPELAETVQVLIPADRNLHDYTLSITDLKRLKAADTIFWLGAESEPFIAKVQKRLDKNNQWVAVANPHSHAWLNVEQLPVIVEKMVNVLVANRPSEKAKLEQRAENFLKAVTQRQSYWQQQLQLVANTPFLLGHDAFADFARNIGLKHAELYRAGHDHGHAQGGMHELLAIQKKLRDGEINCAMQEPEVDFTHLAKRYPNLKLAYIEPMAKNIIIAPLSYMHFFDATAQAFQQCLQAKE